MIPFLNTLLDPQRYFIVFNYKQEDKEQYFALHENYLLKQRVNSNIQYLFLNFVISSKRRKVLLIIVNRCTMRVTLLIISRCNCKWLERHYISQIIPADK